MAITFKNVEHVARLAHLRLSISEMEKMTRELNSILEYAEKLNELDTRNVAPTASVIPAKNVLRRDAVHEPLETERVLDMAPRVQDSYVVVPKPIED